MSHLHSDSCRVAEPVTVATTEPLGVDVRVTLDEDTTPSGVVDRLATSTRLRDSVQQALVAALTDLAPDEEHRLAAYLRANGVTALSGAYAAAAARYATARNDARDDDCRDRAVTNPPALPTDTDDETTPAGADDRVDGSTLVAATAAFGADHPGPFGFHQPLSEWKGALPPLLRALPTSARPRLAIRVRCGFLESVRADQRRAVLRDVLAPLCGPCDVVFVCGGVTAGLLRERHADDLPGVASGAGAGGEDTAPDASVAEVVETAAEELGVTGGPVRTLRKLADTPSQTASYADLTASLPFARATVRDHVGTLVDLGLAHRHGPQSDRRVTLSDAGRQFVREQITVQRRLEDIPESALSTSDRTTEDAVYTRASTGGGATAGTDRTAARIRWLDRATTAEAVGATRDGSITMVDRPVERWGRADRGWPEPRLSVTDDGTTAVVGVEPQGPLPLVTSTALALWDGRGREAIWTDDTLAPLNEALSSDVETDALRRIRTLGWLPEDVETAAEWRGQMGEAAENLRDMTTKLGNDPADPEGLRSDIMRCAHGMLGVAAQVAALCDVDLVHQLRFPEWRRSWWGASNRNRRHDVFRTLRHLAAVGSTYCGHTVYRHLYEDREEKRDQTPTPTVDAADPVGSLAVSIQLVGDGVTDATDEFRSFLAAGEEHEDAPGFGVDVPVRTPDRTDWREVITRALDAKNIAVRPEAVRTARALVGSPHDVAEGITRGLSPEEDRRRVRPREIGRAAATLDPDRLLTEQPRSAGKLVATLLRADGWRLTRSELADAAGVSTRTVRRHGDVLRSLNLVSVTERTDDDGNSQERWRITVRHSWPWPTRDDIDLQELLVGVVGTVGLPDGVDESEWWRNPPDTFADLPDPWPVVDRWAEVLAALVGIDPPDTAHREQDVKTGLDAASDGPSPGVHRPGPRVARLGEVDQTALTDVAAEVAAT